MSQISPTYALAHAGFDEFFEALTESERLVLAFNTSLLLRPEQLIARYPWRSWGFVSARGFGKSLTVAAEINRRVHAGEARKIALMAPTEDRVKEVQVDFLVSTSPPWFKAEPYKDGVVWPNGVIAEGYTPEAPGRTRSGNFDLSWLCEIVDWLPTTRLEAYRNIATATRVGAAQIIWDTTSKGKNDVIQLLMAENARDPRNNVVIRGTSFDNPMLSRKYLQALVRTYPKGSRRYQEEIEGAVFNESAGALWQQSWIDTNRRHLIPSACNLKLVSIDPSLSAGPEADECGFVVACRDNDREAYVLKDLSTRMPPELWASMAVDECCNGAAGVVVERNHAGDMPRDLIKVHAGHKGLKVVLLDAKDKDKPFPSRTPGVIYLRELVSSETKGDRAAAPASLYEQGHVHHVGTFEELELEMTTWEPGVTRSPNRLDACAQAITELLDVRVPQKVAPDVNITAVHRAQKELRRLGERRLRGLGI